MATNSEFAATTESLGRLSWISYGQSVPWQSCVCGSHRVSARISETGYRCGRGHFISRTRALGRSK